VFCIERNCVIEEGFCHYVCPKTRECPRWKGNNEVLRAYAKPIYYNQQVETAYPPTERLDPRVSAETQHRVNFTPNRLLETPNTTIHQLNDLRKAPWIGHVEGYQWPECECVACCSELLINLMQETHRSHRQKTQQPFNGKAALI
jgi:hypothetical protein